jgi:hypothetical protein
MMEQNTITTIAQTAHDFGWFGTMCVIGSIGFLLHVLYTFRSSRDIKKKAFDPIERFYTDIKSLNEKVTKVYTDVTEKVSYEWVENKFKDYNTKEIANLQYENLNKRLDELVMKNNHIEELLIELRREFSEYKKN